MKIFALWLLSLFLLPAVALGASDPYPITIETTQTSFTLSWTAVPEVASYTIMRITDRNYSGEFVTLATVTEPIWTLNGLEPGTFIDLVIVSDPNPFGLTQGTQVTVQTRMAPFFGDFAMWGDYEHYGIGALYAYIIGFDGWPTPILSILEGPTGMRVGLERNGAADTIYWNGDSNEPVPVTLRIANSEGVADFSFVSIPTEDPPIVPAAEIPWIYQSIDGNRITAEVRGLTPFRVRLFAKRPGGVMMNAGYMLKTGPTTYVFDYPFLAGSGRYVFATMVKASRSGRPTWSDDIIVNWP